jgi:hypothetical protein
MLEDLVLGQRDPAYFDLLADKLAEAIMASRIKQSPTTISIVHEDASYHIWNRLDPSLQPDSNLYTILFHDESPAAAKPYHAILGLFAAHATAATPANLELSPDYPGGFVEYARQMKWTDYAMFAAGAVGDAAPNFEPQRTEAQRAHMMGRHLGSILLRNFQRNQDRAHINQATLQSAVVEIDLPHPRITLKRGWRLSPIITNAVLNQSSTQLHVLQIGPLVLVGFPGDVGGGISQDLAEWGKERGLTILTTSFNGDYIGYIIQGDRATEFDTYETTLMNFFGQRNGDYLSDMAKQVVTKLTSTPAAINQP